METTAVIPTLGRETLAAAVKSLELQTEAPAIIVLQDSRDTLIKLKEGFEQAKTELVAICDDDAVYPADWIQKLTAAFGIDVGYAGGAVIPHIKEGSNHTERAIGQVTSSYFGTSNMSYRLKVPTETKDADETNLIGNGLYRRELFLRILQDYDRVPVAAWETYILTRIRELGYRTISVKGVYFWHKQRSTIRNFATQIYRCGIGRANYFKQFPRQAVKKYFILFPPVFVVYLGVYAGLQIFAHSEPSGFPPFWGFWPIATYFLIDLIATVYTVHTDRLFAFFLFPIMHISYGVGMLTGLIRKKATWN